MMSFYRFGRAIVKFGVFFKFRVKAVGIENIPKDGAAILAVNHSSNHDPVMVGITCPRDLKFMAKAELFKNKFIGGILLRLGAFPVHRGKGDLAAIKTALKIFNDGGMMLIFPEGGRGKDGKARRAKPGVALIAQKSGVPVIPVHITGKYKYMGRVTVNYGKPIPFEQYKGIRMNSEEIQSLADGILEEIYKCGEEV